MFENICPRLKPDMLTIYRKVPDKDDDPRSIILTMSVPLTTTVSKYTAS